MFCFRVLVTGDKKRNLAGYRKSARSMIRPPGASGVPLSACDAFTLGQGLTIFVAWAVKFGRLCFLRLEAPPEVLEVRRPGGKRRIGYRRHAWQIRINQRRNLVPHAEVILDQVMRLIQRPGVPAVVVAIYRTVFVGHSNVSKHSRLCWIEDNNLRSAMERASCLIEIYCFCN